VNWSSLEARQRWAPKVSRGPWSTLLAVGVAMSQTRRALRRLVGGDISSARGWSWIPLVRTILRECGERHHDSIWRGQRRHQVLDVGNACGGCPAASPVCDSRSAPRPCRVRR
jgi:hypothetical protein